MPRTLQQLSRADLSHHTFYYLECTHNLDSVGSLLQEGIVFAHRLRTVPKSTCSREATGALLRTASLSII